MTPITKHNFRIFIVDDDEMVRSIYHQHLQNGGYTDITLFKGGQDCLNALNKLPEVVFLDQEMEGLAGMEVLKRIKSLYPKVYVVVISAQEDSEIAAAALQYGAFDYVTKGEGDLQRLSAVLQRIKVVQEMLDRNERRFYS